MPATTFDNILKKENTPTGCGVLVMQDGKILAGSRIERAGKGKLCGPGGHIEPGETPEEGARREAYEEFGIVCNELTPLGVQTGRGSHGRSAVFLCTDFSGKPKTDEMEMTEPQWILPGEITEEEAYPPFYQSLQLLPEEGENLMKDKDFKILKADDDQRLVFGWASVIITVDGEKLEDLQHDMIDPEDLEEAAYEYVLNFRDTGEEHLPGYRKKGKLVESCVFTPEKQKAMGIPEGIVPVAWWIGFKIDDEATWRRIKDGTYKMFSIEGKAQREPIEKAKRNYEEFPEYNMWLEENLDATIEEQKAAKEWYKKNRIAKSFDEILEKFNPFHDARGRFSTASGGVSFTITTRDPAKQHWADMAAAREKERTKDWKTPAKPAAATKPSGDFKAIDKAGVKEMKKEMGQNFTQEDIKQMNAHGGGGYFGTGNSFHLNKQLRNGAKLEDLSEDDRKTCETLDKNMKPITRDIKLSRMVNTGFFEQFGIDPDKADTDDNEMKKAVGKVYGNKGYTSTSYDIGENVFTSRKYKLNISAPKGTKAVIRPGHSEAEILLARNTGMVVKGITKKKSMWGGYEYEIDVEVIP